MSDNQQQFDIALNKIGKLYEEGKDCLNKIYQDFFSADEKKDYNRAHEVLREMRDVACVELKKAHKIN